MTELPQKKTYEALDPDAVFVAGTRISDDRTVTLFDEQARYPLLGEQIRLAPAKPNRASKPTNTES
jgi:hypothetical protein